MVKRGLVVGVAGVVAIVLAVGGAVEPAEQPEAGVATCRSAGAPSRGAAGLRPPLVAAGPLAVSARPLSRMVETGDHRLYAAMSVSIRGHRFVVVSVPLALRDRVFLYYGSATGEGDRAASLPATPGYSEIEFQPCPGRARTVWPGAVRVIGTGPVHLLVTIEGGSASTALRLGEPGAAPKSLPPRRGQSGP